MKTLNRLNQLIKERQGHIHWYWVTWEPRHAHPDVGEVWRGYYLHCRIPGYTSQPGQHNWEEYVNGLHIGTTYNRAKAAIIENVPMLDNAHWYNEYKALRKEFNAAMLLLRDFKHWAHSVRFGISHGDLETDFRKRSIELFEEYLVKVDALIDPFFEEE